MQLKIFIGIWRPFLCSKRSFNISKFAWCIAKWIGHIPRSSWPLTFAEMAIFDAKGLKLSDSFCFFANVWRIFSFLLLTRSRRAEESKRNCVAQSSSLSTAIWMRVEPVSESFLFILAPCEVKILPKDSFWTLMAISRGSRPDSSGVFNRIFKSELNSMR